ncbi:MAG TPA: response regulator transcription factor [Chryseosolibacter sp.]
MNFLITDDHAIVRRGLIGILKDVYPKARFFEAGNGREALAMLSRQPMDIMLIDISMPGRNGLETVKQLRAQGVACPILVLSMHSENQYALRALKAGASGFLNKEIATAELVNAVQKVLGGKIYVTSSVAEKLAERLTKKSGNDPIENLSDREMEVLMLLASGKSISEIADELSLSSTTVSTYRARILDKLQLANNAEITKYALENGIV